MIDDNHFMKIALQEAHKAFERGEVPVGAVIVTNQRVIARAHNLTEVLNDVTAHAEMQAITAAADMLGGKYLTDCTLYVTVEPCPMCAGAILNSRIKRLVFGAFDSKGGAAGTIVNLLEDSRFNHQVEIISGVIEEDCKELLQSFFRSLRNK